MFCKKCGNQLEDGAVFCPACGTRQSAELAAASSGAVVIDQQSSKDLLIQQMNDSMPVMTAIKEKENAIEAYEGENLEKLEKKASKGRRNLIAASGMLFYFIGIVITLPIAISKYHKYNKQLDEFKQAKSQLENELAVLKNDAALSWLPYDYRDATSFAMLYSYIQNLRANTLQEAIIFLKQRSTRQGSS